MLGARNIERESVEFIECGDNSLLSETGEIAVMNDCHHYGVTPETVIRDGPALNVLVNPRLLRSLSAVAKPVPHV